MINDLEKIKQEFKEIWDLYDGNKTDENRALLQAKHLELLKAQEPEFLDAIKMAKQTVNEIDDCWIPLEDDYRNIFDGRIEDINRLRFLLFWYFIGVGNELDYFEKETYINYVHDDFKRLLLSVNGTIKPLHHECDIIADSVFNSQYDSRYSGKYSDEIIAIIGEHIHYYRELFKWCADKCFVTDSCFENISFNDWATSDLDKLQASLGFENIDDQITCVLIKTILNTLIRVYGGHFSIWKGLSEL